MKNAWSKKVLMSSAMTNATTIRTGSSRKNEPFFFGGGASSVISGGGTGVSGGALTVSLSFGAVL
jgi:hypothetical protein